MLRRRPIAVAPTPRSGLSRTARGPHGARSSPARVGPPALRPVPLALPWRLSPALPCPGGCPLAPGRCPGGRPGRDPGARSAAALPSPDPVRPSWSIDPGAGAGRIPSLGHPWAKPPHQNPDARNPGPIRPFPRARADRLSPPMVFGSLPRRFFPIGDRGPRQFFGVLLPRQFSDARKLGLAPAQPHSAIRGHRDFGSADNFSGRLFPSPPSPELPPPSNKRKCPLRGD